MKKALIIIGIIFTSYFIMSWILPNIIGIPIAAWNSHQTWKEVEKENKIILEIGYKKLNTDLIGIYEYKTTEKHRNHYIVIDKKKSKLIGFYYGTESSGEHGIFYYRNRIENLKVQGNSIKFNIAERNLYSTTQFRIIKHPKDTIQEIQGISKRILKYNGLITENGLKLNCNSKYDDCWDNSMEFIKRTDKKIDLKDLIEQKLKPFKKYGYEIQNNGTKLIGKAKHIAPLAWLHTIFKGLTDNEINELENKLGTKIPNDYILFLSHSNGLHIFNTTFYLNGLRTSHNRSNEINNRQPFSLKTKNIDERPFNSKSEYFYIGGYDWDGSLIYIDKTNNKVYRCLKDNAEPINMWNDLNDLLASELDRLINLHNENGIEIDEKQPKTP